MSFRRLSEVVAGDSAWDKVLRPARGDNRVAWRPREEVIEGLKPWLIHPREVLKHLPAITLTTFEERRFRQTGAFPLRAGPGTGPCVMLSGDDVLGVMPTNARPGA